MNFKILNLFIYPIKSCGAVELNELKIDENGPLWDRHWMLVDENGKFISQRESPQLALVKVSVASIEGGEFLLAYEKMPEIKLSPSTSSEMKSVSIWKSNVEARLCSDEINLWFSNVVGKKVYLVENHNELTQRKVKKKYGKSLVQFADGYPLLLIGSASLNLLNSKLSSKITIHNFRTNIFVETETPHIEDSWENIQINKINFNLVKKCSRCQVVNIDQVTGEQNSSVLRTLASYRRSQKGIDFGQNLIHLNNGLITINDNLDVTLKS